MEETRVAKHDNMQAPLQQLAMATATNPSSVLGHYRHPLSNAPTPDTLAASGYLPHAFISDRLDQHIDARTHKLRGQPPWLRPANPAAVASN